jgi:hypothetical protein
MRKLSGFGLILLGGCHAPSPVATATPLDWRLRPSDSLAYALITSQPTYYAILALTPGQPIERLAPAADQVTPLLRPGRTIVTFPHPTALASGAGETIRVPRITAGGGYLDELGTSIQSPASLGVTYEVRPGLATAGPSRTLVLVLLPEPLAAPVLDRALPPAAGATPASTVDMLRVTLEVRERLRWVPLTWTTRSAI